MTNSAFIFDAVRTPRGKGKTDGALYGVKPALLLSQVLQALQQRNALDTAQVDEVIAGCVTPVGEQGANIARAASLMAKWHYDHAATQINQFCASGLHAVNIASARVLSGMENCIVAGGVESMSRVPMMSDGGAMAFDPVINMAVNFVPQGVSADLLATLYGISREHCDEYALLSQTRAAQASQQGYFSTSLIPVRDERHQPVLTQDEVIRAELSLDRLAELAPAFAEMGSYGFDATALRQYPQLGRLDHVHTPGNSSAIVDGASAVLIGNENASAQLGRRPRAKIRSYAVVGSEPTLMLDGPIPATHKALKLAGLSVNDIDLFEVNEAFAAVVLRFCRGMGVELDRVNVNGGAIAMGHPLGATGAMLLGTLLDELERQDKQLGVVTLCAAGGMGIATVIERV